MFVSASFGVYLRPLGRRLGVDGVLATELAVDDAGRCTGDLLGAQLPRPEKVAPPARLARRAPRRPGAPSSCGRTATRRATGELLADADHAVWARAADAGAGAVTPALAHGLLRTARPGSG